MKKITIFILTIGLFSLLSCKKDETKAILNSSPGTPSLTVPGGATVVLQKTDSAQMLKFTWTATGYGAMVIPTYTLQMDKQGNNFADPSALGSVNTVREFSIMNYELNGKLLPLLFEPKNPEPLAMEFRIKTVVKDNNGVTLDSIKPVYSAVVKQTITPYYVPIIYPLLGVPGNYQGWHPEDSTTTIASVKSNGKYEGYINFPDPNTEFKFTQGPSWDNNWGDTGANGTLEPGGDNIVAAEAGYYKLNVDLVGLTYTKLKTTWGVIGSATPGGWDNDTPMTYDAANKVWTVTLELTAADIKFRANGAWDLNYGDDGANGSLEAGGANIAVPSAGNYTVTLNLSNPIYKYKLEKN
ncbi:MAG: SusE domain-containing protein [Bacteroidales bacterium]|nr:SusE domain-containing protein [Bacteroidales bacterium]